MIPSSSSNLLDGIRVLDLTRVLAGPYCTQLLGDLGADVIKVERPERGDDTRHWGPPFTESGQSAYFLCANRNKRSITINLQNITGRDILRQLIVEADVLVENFRTGTLEGWGFDYDVLQNIRPGLIYCTITGYGHSGPYKDRAGYDFMVQAMGGFMSVTGEPDGSPMRAGVAIADLSAGIFASNAILASLFARERTGKGQRIDMSLLESQVAFMSYVASNYLVSGELPTRYGNGHPNIVPYQEFKAQDRYFTFAAGNDHQWGKFCEAVGKEAWRTDERFATNQARVKNRTEVVAMLNALFAGKSASEWMALCDDMGVPTAPINTFDQVLADPQVQARDLQQHIQRAGGESIPLLASPLNIPTAPTTIRYPPPLLGEHTYEILHEVLGVDGGQVDEWRNAGII